jgi:hypothetical protein
MRTWQTTRLAAGCLAAILAVFAMQQGAHAQDPQQIERGAEAWANNCNRCHNMRPVADISPEGWFVVVQHMRVRAGLPGALADDIRAFLTGGH